MNASRSLLFFLALTGASDAQAAPLSAQDPVYRAVAAADAGAIVTSTSEEPR